ncbi:mas-related G-protein coupled receptor member H-like [Lissotriton helveticus]
MTEFENLINTTAPTLKNSTGNMLPFGAQLTMNILAVIIIMIGLVGNAIVFWFLFIKIKRNQCTVYILNLAVADFTFLVGCAIYLMFFLFYLCGVKVTESDNEKVFFAGNLLYDIGFNASTFVLTAISVERFVSVLLPIWHRCHRPKWQSTAVSAVLWALSVLVTGLETFLCQNSDKYQEPGSGKCTAVYLFTSALFLVTVSLMVLSSLTLLLEIRKTSKQCRPLRLYIVIIVTVMVFLLNVVPARVIGLLLYFKILPSEVYSLLFFYITEIFTSIHCSMNPYIYIFVGRWRKQGPGITVKQAFEKVFKEETESTWQTEATSMSSLNGSKHR